jgi:hypothetical protein
MSIKDFADDLWEINGVDTLEITRYDDDPSRVTLRFKKASENGE